MNKVTLTQTNVILLSDTTKLSLEKLIGEIAKMDSELKEVKEKIGYIWMLCRVALVTQMVKQRINSEV